MYGMTLLFLIYSILMTIATFAVSVYLFVKEMPSSGTPVLFFCFFSALFTWHIFARYSQERLLRALRQQMTDIEVVVVPSLLLRGRQYPLGVPKDSPSNQRAQ